MIGDVADLMSAEYFEEGARACRTVGRITVAEEPHGTGFFVGLDLILTNHHVIDSHKTALVSTMVMNVEENRFGDPIGQEEFELDPDRFFYTDKRLDFTIVSAKRLSLGNVTAASFGYRPLMRGEGKILIGKSVNIIHHPGAQNKMASFRKGVMVELTNGGGQQDFCYYTADTKQGSSGAPVFNDLWQVVALHHHAFPKIDVNGNLLDKDGKQISKNAALQNPKLIVWEANEGTRISRLVKNFESGKLSSLEMEGIRTKLLASWG
jgi:V8-like Glu-specific endopeptidase